jgi:hypothetical protein
MASSHTQLPLMIRLAGNQYLDAYQHTHDITEIKSTASSRPAEID